MCPVNWFLLYCHQIKSSITLPFVKNCKTKLNMKEITFCMALWQWMTLGCSILTKKLNSRALNGCHQFLLLPKKPRLLSVLEKSWSLCFLIMSDTTRHYYVTVLCSMLQHYRRKCLDKNVKQILLEHNNAWPHVLLSFYRKKYKYCTPPTLLYLAPWIFVVYSVYKDLVKFSDLSHSFKIIYSEEKTDGSSLGLNSWPPIS